MLIFESPSNICLSKKNAHSMRTIMREKLEKYGAEELMFEEINRPHVLTPELTT